VLNAELWHMRVDSALTGWRAVHFVQISWLSKKRHGSARRRKHITECVPSRERVDFQIMCREVRLPRRQSEVIQADSSNPGQVDEPVYRLP